MVSRTPWLTAAAKPAFVAISDQSDLSAGDFGLSVVPGRIVHDHDFDVFEIRESIEAAADLGAEL